MEQLLPFIYFVFTVQIVQIYPI